MNCNENQGRNKEECNRCIPKYVFYLGATGLTGLTGPDGSNANCEAAVCSYLPVGTTGVDINAERTI